MQDHKSLTLIVSPPCDDYAIAHISKETKLAQLQEKLVLFFFFFWQVYIIIIFLSNLNF